MSFGDLGKLLTQQAVPQMPVLNQQQQERTGPWRNLMQKIQSDPNLKMALLQTGLAMMKGNQPGETGFDIFSNAAQRGLQTFDQLNQRDRTQTIEDSQRAKDNARADTRLGQFDQQLGLQRQAQRDRNANAEANRDLRRELSDRNYDLALKQLQETTSARTGSTGQERILDTIASSLQTAYPNLYEGDEGRARALLEAAKFNENPRNPESRARGIIALMQMYQQDQAARLEAAQLLDTDPGTVLSPEQMMQQATGLYNGIIEPLDQQAQPGADAASRGAGQYNGKTFNYNGQEAKILFDPSRGYKVYVGGRPSDQWLDEDQARALVEGSQ